MYLLQEALEYILIAIVVLRFKKCFTVFLRVMIPLVKMVDQYVVSDFLLHIFLK